MEIVFLVVRLRPNQVDCMRCAVVVELLAYQVYLRLLILHEELLASAELLAIQSNHR